MDKRWSTRGKYILNGRTPIPCIELVTWGLWYENNKEKTRVAETVVKDKRVSTVFLGLDHRLSDNGPPILFETMVFPLENYTDERCERYCTWEEAEAGHKRIVEEIQNPPPTPTGESEKE